MKMEIPPHLDFTSDKFDPGAALKSKNVYLPFPLAKTYNNIAEYYSRTFLRKEIEASRKKEVITRERNYRWFYKTLGQRFPPAGHAICRKSKFSKRKVATCYILSEPLRSERVISLRSDYKSYWRNKWQKLRTDNVASESDLIGSGVCRPCSPCENKLSSNASEGGLHSDESEIDFPLFYSSDDDSSASTFFQAKQSEYSRNFEIKNRDSLTTKNGVGSPLPISHIAKSPSSGGNDKHVVVIKSDELEMDIAINKQSLSTEANVKNVLSDRKVQNSPLKNVQNHFFDPKRRLRFPSVSPRKRSRAVHTQKIPFKQNLDSSITKVSTGLLNLKSGSSPSPKCRELNSKCDKATVEHNSITVTNICTCLKTSSTNLSSVCVCGAYDKARRNIQNFKIPKKLKVS